MDTIILEQIMTQQYQKLLRKAQVLVKHSFDAEDVVQNAYLKAWRSCQHTEVLACEAWLSRIVYRECISLLRKRSRQPITYDADILGRLIETRSSTYDRCVEMHQLKQTILGMPKRYSVPLLLCYYDGYSMCEVAQKLHLPPSTVRCHLSRGRQMIRASYCQEAINSLS